MSCPTHRAGLRVTATRPSRTRRDGALEVIGCTDFHGNQPHILVWRVHPGPPVETPIPAVQSASRRIPNAARGLVQLGGEWVNESDTTALFHAAMQAIRSGAFICRNDYTPLASDGHCPECVRLDHGGDY